MTWTSSTGSWGGAKCLSVASFGELTFFTKKTLSSPRPERCTDWTTPVGEDPWDARKYATDDECKRWLGIGLRPRAGSHRRGNLRMA